MNLTTVNTETLGNNRDRNVSTVSMVSKDWHMSVISMNQTTSWEKVEFNIIYCTITQRVHYQFPKCQHLQWSHSICDIWPSDTGTTRKLHFYRLSCGQTKADTSGGKATSINETGCGRYITFSLVKLDLWIHKPSSSR